MNVVASPGSSILRLKTYEMYLTKCSYIAKRDRKKLPESESRTLSKALPYSTPSSSCGPLPSSKCVNCDGTLRSVARSIICSG